jgi:hypothetical protein
VRHLIKRMVGTIMKAKSPKGCLYLFVGNMYPTVGSILRKLKTNPMWVKFIVGGILADGTSLWEDLQPLRQLIEELESDRAMGEEEQFYAEVLNDETAGIKAGIDISKIPTCPYDLEFENPEGRFIIIDPSGDKWVSDMNAVGLFGMFSGKPVFIKAEQGHWSPLELIKRSLAMAIDTRTRLVVVENVAYQASLLFWFNYVCNEVGISGIDFVPINPKGKAKNGRIKNMLKGLIRPQPGKEVEQYLGPEVRAVVVAQIQAWNPLQAKNTDELLDLLAYVPQVLLEYSGMISTEFDLGNEDYNSAQVLPAHMSSPF